ncbi:MAG: PqqD family peptide modification chaperone [Bacteroidaceae bacterium]|nr:PqqD family protein [Bacteroidaceae bacterium]
MSKKNKISIYDVVPKRGRHLLSEEQEDGLVRLIIPRFTNNFMRHLLERMGRDSNIHITLEEHGSAIWRLIDGKRTVKDIIENLNEHFNNEENYEYRIIKYIMTLRQQQIIVYATPPTENNITQ